MQLIQIIGISTIERAETFIEIGADTSFNRVEDGQVSGFVCPGMDSTGVGGAGGGGGGKVKYDTRYKKKFNKFLKMDYSVIIASIISALATLISVWMSRN